MNERASCACGPERLAERATLGALQVVRRWVNEVQTALSSDSQSVQYHALALLHQIKRQDRLAVSKVVASLTRTPLKSPMAQCLLIRYAKRVMEDEPNPEARDRALFDYLESSLRHKSDMVIYEAATAICSLSGVTQRELAPAVTVLQLFLCSPKPCLRFAAVRTLNKVAMIHPLAVTPCNMDMEGLINDSNRSIATLAITTLLKTGSESGVERLMKQITSFMGARPRLQRGVRSRPRPRVHTHGLATPCAASSSHSRPGHALRCPGFTLTAWPRPALPRVHTHGASPCAVRVPHRTDDRRTASLGIHPHARALAWPLAGEIADEFKIVVVDAIRAMCLKFPQKHRVLMAFLSNVLREEGGFQYKKAIVDTILVIIAKVGEAKEAGLGHLCEFIEDCEFTLLSTQILYLLGLEGPVHTPPPAHATTRVPHTPRSPPWTPPARPPLPEIAPGAGRQPPSAERTPQPAPPTSGSSPRGGRAPPTHPNTSASSTTAWCSRTRRCVPPPSRRLPNSACSSTTSGRRSSCCCSAASTTTTTRCATVPPSSSPCSRASRRAASASAALMPRRSS